MLAFKKNIRFRREENFIIICDCKNLLDFEAPLYLEPLLKALAEDYDEAHPIGLPNEAQVLADFKELGIVSSNPQQSTDSNIDIWSALPYSEREFYI